MATSDPSYPDRPIDPSDPRSHEPAGASAPARAPAAPKRTKKRWWLRITLALLLLIVLLVAFAPTLAGTAPVRAIVVNQINSNLNGSVAIDDYSVGWTGGVKANGVKVYDANKNLVLQVPRVSTKLSLLDAARGNLDLGDTQIDVSLDDVRIDKDGNVNLADIAKDDPSAKPRKPREEGPIELPNVKGKLTLNILGGKVTGEALPNPVSIQPSTVVLNIPAIDQPLENSVKLAYRVGDAQPSTIEASGTVDAVENGKVDFEKLQKNLRARQKLTLTNVDLAPAGPFLKPALGEGATLGGIVSGGLEVAAEGLTGISADGEIVVANAAFTGGPVKDNFVTERISIPVQITRTVVDPTTTLIKIQKLSIDSPLAKLNVSGEVAQEAVTNLAESRAPGKPGQVKMDVSVPDFAAVARKLPKTLQLAEGVQVNGGSLTQTTTIDITAAHVVATQKLDVAVNGTRDGKPIAIGPAHLESHATAIPNGKPVPALRDLKLLLDSKFATLRGGGESLAAFSLDGDFDLAKLHQEVSQFSEMGGVELAGTGKLQVKTTGDPTAENAPIAAVASVNVANLRVTGMGERPVEAPRVALNASGTVSRANGSPASIDDAKLTFQTGDAGKPLVDVAAAAKVDLTNNSVPRFELSKLAIDDLAEVQRKYGALVPALNEQQIQLRSGGLYVQVAGSYDGKTVALDPAKPLGLSIPNLVIDRAGKPLLAREDIAATIAGNVTLADAITADLNQLQVTSKSGLFAVSKTGDAPIRATVDTTKGGIAGNGALAIAADLKRLNDLAQAFGGTVQAQGAAGQLTSGRLESTLQLAQANETKINFNAKVLNLSVTSHQKPIENETVTIALAATAPADMSGVNVASATVDSRFANAKVSDASLKLSGGVWDMLQRASVEANVPDLPAVWSLKEAFAPPTAAPAPQARGETTGAQPLMMQAAPDDGGVRGDEPITRPRRRADRRREAEQRKQQEEQRRAAEADAPAVPLEPLQVTSGSAALKLNVSRDASAGKTNVALSDLRVSQLAIARGAQRYAFPDDIAMKLAASVTATEAPQAITVSEMSGSLGGVATLSMPQPINATGLADTKQVNASGAVRIEGALEKLTELLAVLQGGQRLPYSGQYVTTQTISSKPGNADQGMAVSLDGDLTATDFKVLNADGKPAVVERQVVLKNGLDAFPDRKLARVRTLTLSMPESNAAGLQFAGEVVDWDTNRFMKGVEGEHRAALLLTYDLEKLWPILKPMLSPETQESLKTAKIAGKHNQKFEIWGKYPNRPTFAESIKYLNVQGGIGVGLFDYSGLKVTELAPTFVLEKGVARITGGGTANEGKLNLNGIALDLAYADPLLSIPKNTKLLENVKLNPVLADSLGKLGAVVLTNASQAEGLIQATVTECDRVPLAGLIQKSSNARFAMVLEIPDLHLDGVVPQVISLAANLGTGGIRGRVPPSTISIADGQANSDLAIVFNRRVQDKRTGREVDKEMPLKFTGGLGLEKLDLRNFVVSIPPDLVIKDLRKFAPNGAVIPLRGLATKPELDIQEFVADNAVNAITGGATGGETDPGKAIGDLLEGFRKKKKDK
jgi:hypothetical protein